MDELYIVYMYETSIHCFLIRVLHVLFPTIYASVCFRVLVQVFVLISCAIFACHAAINEPCAVFVLCVTDQNVPVY